MLKVKIWDSGCGAEITIDSEGLVEVVNSGGCDIDGILGGSVLHYADTQAEALADEILAAWLADYAGDASANGLHVVVTNADGRQLARVTA